jgi:hypothetical protein
MYFEGVHYPSIKGNKIPWRRAGKPALLKGSKIAPITINVLRWNK